MERYIVARVACSVDVFCCVLNLWMWRYARNRKIAWIFNFPAAVFMAVYAAYWWFRMRWPV